MTGKYPYSCGMWTNCKIDPPHPPYDKVPKKYIDLYDDIPLKDNVPEELHNDKEYLQTIKEYYGAISGLDENFKRILDYLRDNHLEEL